MYEQPCFCARSNAQIPAGTTWTPGRTPLNQSFRTSSGSSPILWATIPLYTEIARLHTQNKAPRSCIRLMPSTPLKGKSPSFASKYGFRMEGALVLLSLILNISPNLYFFQIRSSNPKGMALCRNTHIAVISLSREPV